MIRLQYKLLLAAASGIACGFVYVFVKDEPGGFPGIWWWAFYILPGALFAAAVLFPYLQRDRTIYWRAAGLVVLSSLSYWSAVQVALLGTDWVPSREDMLLASLAGATIVMVGVLFIAPIRASVAYFLLGLVASIIGWLLFYYLFDFLDYLDYIPGAAYPPYAIWHILIAAAIHVGSPSTQLGERVSSWLMPRRRYVVFIVLVVLALPYVYHEVAYIVNSLHWRYENGQKKFEENYVKQRMEGLWTSRYENGQKRYKATLVNGQIEGLWTSWYENGQKQAKGNYVNGLEDGLWTSWYENGQKKIERTYVNGQKNGPMTFWHENGQKSHEGHYVNGQRDGLETWWYENGQKQAEGNYVNGNPEGPKTEWDENGNRL